MITAMLGSLSRWLARISGCTTSDLSNRLYFNQYLSQQISLHPAHPIAVFILELDHLETVYCTLGHAIAGSLIDAFGQRMAKDLAPYGFSRFSDNAFVCGLLAWESKQDISEFAEKLLAFLEEPVHLDTLCVDLSGHLGIALYPEHASDPELLLQRADTAMFHARKDPKRYAYYKPESDPYHRNQLSLMSELRFGLSQDQCQLHFQPKVSLKTSEMVGAEALLRWHHPKLGPIPPDQFILQAELTGQIHHVTSWAIRKAFEQLKAWQSQNLWIELAINLSAKDLLHKQLADTTQECLNFYKIDPRFLTFEITESAFMNDPDRCLKLITKLHKLGFRFAIDDFGIGYSSFSYLKRLPLHELKIDKIFVNQITLSDQEAAIAQTLIELAHRLNLVATAEGVENESIMNRLAQLGCDLGQGYFYSKALSLQELSVWLHESPFAYRGSGLLE